MKLNLNYLRGTNEQRVYIIVSFQQESLYPHVYEWLFKIIEYLLVSSEEEMGHSKCLSRLVYQA